MSSIVEDDMSIWVTTSATSRKVVQLQSDSKMCLAFVEQARGDRAAVPFGEAQSFGHASQEKSVGARKFRFVSAFSRGTRIQRVLPTQSRHGQSRMERQVGKADQKYTDQSNNEVYTYCAFEQKPEYVRGITRIR